jgi:hypothetical protein
MTPIPDIGNEIFEYPSTDEVMNLMNKVNKNVRYIIRKKSKVAIDSKSAI